jgi:hypothetical protein
MRLTSTGTSSAHICTPVVRRMDNYTELLELRRLSRLSNRGFGISWPVPRARKLLVLHYPSVLLLHRFGGIDGFVVGNRVQDL